ncbi:AAA family ATPase [Streptomyces sp. NBC_01477]|uniref:AAA family ATPase n=1 Tax=Streptomyces sp. NBC_01477 TaxID=2976015 RepID=UPI002E3314C9|nr:AAA family ATPase [Streptomyces sp. NBC_01477]
MRLQIENLTLVGTNRTLDFVPGLNAITGGMSGGKTAVISCLRALLGGKVDVVPELEGRTIAGTVRIGERRFRIVRRLVTTQTAKVEIAELGSSNAWRLPVSQLEAGYDQTYRDWLLDQLELPRVRVPKAPTKESSDLTPVSISDYLMYCLLRQQEIDASVFGTPDNYSKNIKRKYVFEILYGLYSPEAAELREKLREVTAQLSAFTADASTLERILAETPFASRAQLEVQHSDTDRQLQQARRSRQSIPDRLADPVTVALRQQVVQAEAELAEVDTAVMAETAARASLSSLRDQLVAQSRRLTRALIAERLLNDFEFHNCPRCGADVPERGDDDTCRLCLQTPPLSPSPSTLAAEQDRIIEQVAETDSLIERSSQRLDQLHAARTQAAQARTSIADRLEQAASSYITDHAEAIRRQAADEARLEEHLARIDDSLKLYLRLEDQTERVARLERERDELTSRMERTHHSDIGVAARLNHLDTAFENTLRSFDAPRFDAQASSYIDRKTYLPIVDGRPFNKLQSQGVSVLVNVAHVLAHQLTALGDPDSVLPNILIIDGVGSNVGHEGIDLTRLRNVYRTLQQAAADHDGNLQIIVTDNDRPPIPGVHTVVELSDTDRFVPQPEEEDPLTDEG